MRARHFMPLYEFWLEHLWWRIAARIILGLAVFTFGVLLFNAFVFTPIKDPDYGVSFSQKRSEELGLDWHQNFTALLDDLQFKRFRLMSYWDLIEASRGQFNFKDLDWQMDQAASHGAKISLSIGVRVPRWPECHEPGWAKQMGGHGWKQALYAYMQVVVDRYKHHPALDTWQLENEGLNTWFGTCSPPDNERLHEELVLVKRWDPNHKVIMSLSDQHTYPIDAPVPDTYGFSVYRIVWNDKIPPHGYIYYPTPIWYHRLRASIINLFWQRPVMVHELQMEPWGPRDTKDMSVEEQNKSMSIEQIPRVFHFARQLGIKRIDLWGSEWWYWRKINGDGSIWQAVREQLNAP